MISKKLQKITSICLFAAVLFGLVAVGVNWQPAQAIDPFAEMKDEYLTDSLSAPDSFSRDTLAGGDSGSANLLSPEAGGLPAPDRPLSDPDAGIHRVAVFDGITHYIAVHYVPGNERVPYEVNGVHCEIRA